MIKIIVLLFILSTSAIAADVENDCDNKDLANTAIDAALDDRTGIYNLGVEFYTGKCIKQSYENAARMWAKAVDLGHVDAKNNLGYLLYVGLGIEKDEKRAVLLWREAASVGHAEAQAHLGDALFNGRGVAQDNTLGLAWILRAIESAKAQPDNGGGDDVLALATKYRESIVSVNPELLEPAEKMAATLIVNTNGL